jgi:hypothetical protein
VNKKRGQRGGIFDSFGAFGHPVKNEEWMEWLNT